MAEPEGHPDRGLLTRARAALDWWESQDARVPTSSLAGTGAVGTAERLLAGIVGREHALALPSATTALRVALLTCGVGPGDDVLVPALDWTAGIAAVASVGARSIPVGPSPGTVAMAPAEARRCRTRWTRAVIATHLLGVTADVPALRSALPGLPVIEDCAQALGAGLDGELAGSLGHLAVFSGKGLDVDGIGFLVTGDTAAHGRAVRLSQHPLRQLLEGHDPDDGAFGQRMPDLGAVLAAHALHEWPTRAEAARRSEPVMLARATLAGATALTGGRRTPVPGRLPVLLLGPHAPAPLGWAGSGARVHPDVEAEARAEFVDRAARAGLVSDGRNSSGPETKEDDPMAGNKSEQAKAQSAVRSAAQQQRGSNKFKNGSNQHNGASRAQSGQPKR